ncbi:Modification methylase DpnIIB [Rubripirellula obstinata]|uniref:Methyltransferase n=1 Tax=Rubripirellula obstinata TaxID=406547 RepID=A0A5B1CEL2_9BACT|nr:DNA modification methylase [Rubripirellula obstinata]KAA1258305.1 Modification methylase DpnIIB [Rubripirellula obstinata]
MQVEMWTLDRIKPYENNPRLNDDAVDAVIHSINEFGFRQPIVVDTDGVIIVGHTRFKAAMKIGLAEVPVHVAVDMEPEAVRAYRIADNRTGENAEWDYDLLPLEIGALQDVGFDCEMLGFDSDELAKLLNPGVDQGLTDPDEVPEPPDDAITQPGDVWILGDHRLMCGDSSKPEDLDRLLDGQPIHLVHMDPPYNVSVSPRSKNAIAAGNSTFAGDGKKAKGEQKMRAKDRPLANDFISEDEFDRLLLAWFENASRVLVPGGCAYVWGGYANLGNYPGPLKQAGIYFSQAIVWDKQHPVMTRKDFMGAFEICFYGWKEGAGHKYYGPNNATDLWHVKKVNPQAMVHLTEKPVELAVNAIQYSSKHGQNVLDLFGGSGSTLIGAEQTGRNAFLMELDPPYCDVIVERWEKFTGKKAERVAKEVAA